MLTELTIENVALVEFARLRFADGFTVLTGETGSGKSVLLDALGMALGARVGVELVRTGTSKARSEVVFHLDPTRSELVDLFAQHGIDSDDPVVVLSREIDAGGRSTARLNGRTVPVGVLREWAARLIDVHGQHEHQSLLDEARHINIVDSWAGNDAAHLARETSSAFSQWKSLLKEQSQLLADSRQRARDMDILSFQCEEIDAAALISGEEDELQRDQERLASAERLSQASNTAYRLFDQTLESISKAVVELEKVESIDPALETILQSARSALYNAEDAARECRNYRDQVEFLPERLDQIQERLDMLRSLKRKYGETIDDILDYRESIRVRLDNLQNAEERGQMLEERIARAKDDLDKAAQALSQLRRRAACQMEIDVRRHLADLAMGSAQFEVQFASIESGANGADAVAFRLSTNPGVPPKPLAKIASGGEISRVMLALKSAFAQSGELPTLVFDEVDAGIGGQTGVALAKKLQGLAGNTQVLCITHLPQVAARATHHFRVEKQTDGTRTVLSIETLDETGRVREIARMLGDPDATTAQQHAVRLIADRDE